MKDLFHNNHYTWLQRNFITFLERLGFEDARWCDGLIVAHGDKGYQYKDRWAAEGVPFNQGMAIYLLTYLLPWSYSVRETNEGWVDPCEWVVKHYRQYQHHFEGLE